MEHCQHQIYATFNFRDDVPVDEKDWPLVTAYLCFFHSHQRIDDPGPDSQAWIDFRVPPNTARDNTPDRVEMLCILLCQAAYDQISEPEDDRGWDLLDQLVSTNNKYAKKIVHIGKGGKDFSTHPWPWSSPSTISDMRDKAPQVVRRLSLIEVSSPSDTEGTTRKPKF